MKRAVAPAAAVTCAALVIAAAFALGHRIGSTGSAGRSPASVTTVTRAYVNGQARSGTAGPAASAASSVPCAITNNGFAILGHPGRNSVSGTCTLTVVTTPGNGEIKVHWPGGHGTRPVTTTYVLGLPQR